MMPSLRTLAKNAFFLVCFLCGLFSLFRLLHRNRLLILAYHGVLPDSVKGDEYLDHNFIPATVFRWQMQYLKQHYTILPLREIICRLEQEISLPRYAAAVTFDDGFRNNLTVAFPILQELNIPFAVFVTTGFIGTQKQMLWAEKLAYFLKHTSEKVLDIVLREEKITVELSTEKQREQAANRVIGTLKRFPPVDREQCLEQFYAFSDFQTLKATVHEERYRFLDWSEVRTLADAGVEIGSHTVNHEILSLLSPEEVWHEITTSKKEIEGQLERPCYLFNYPNGSIHDFSGRDKQALQQAGYRGAMSLTKELNSATIADMMDLKRINIGRRHNTLLFMANVSGFLPFCRNIVATLRGSLRRLRYYIILTMLNSRLLRRLRSSQ
jgi:peptidoglycan/xylan/chitin deacetylase (PgdA/CDA1 family)